MVPDYWMERPPLRVSTATEAAVAAVLELADARPGERLLDVDSTLRETPEVRRWQFLCGLAALRPGDALRDRRPRPPPADAQQRLPRARRHRRVLLLLLREPGRTSARTVAAGYVYFLPADTFVEQPAGTYAGHAAHVPQLASPVAVTPFARLRVAPSDFPFLDRIRGHDDDRLAEYA